ncbi:MAG: DUF4469 domain-containing protein [Verrucomicrobiaceae bacterium]|nr:DUF4469 domain-containing protein [Verrucomicrobiaceae bacterium]
MPTPLTWDSPAGLTYDMPGLTWDMQAPDPPPPKPKKTFRRSPNANPPPTPTATHPMSTFTYHPAPKSSGGFTTRAALGDAVTTDFITAQVATATGLTPVQVESAVKTFFQTLLACSAGCGWSNNLYDIVRFRPTSGGSSPQPDGFHNADDINADVALSYTKEAIDAWRATLTLESLGEVGKVTPIIDTILNQDTGEADKYTPGSLIQLRGDNLKLNRADITQGVFFKAGAAAEVRATSYADIEPLSLTVLVPASLSGPLTVRVAAHINGSVRSYTYTNFITP